MTIFSLIRPPNILPLSSPTKAVWPPRKVGTRRTLLVMESSLLKKQRRNSVSTTRVKKILLMTIVTRSDSQSLQETR